MSQAFLIHTFLLPPLSSPSLFRMVLTWPSLPLFISLSVVAFIHLSLVPYTNPLPFGPGSRTKYLRLMIRKVKLGIRESVAVSDRLLTA